MLNIPWTLLGLLLAFTCVPSLPMFDRDKLVIIFPVRLFWWGFGPYFGIRAATMGHVVLLGPQIRKNDLEHELIHVEQFTRYPFLFPLIALVEILRHGTGLRNRFEREAYEQAGNVYLER
jgi:hypothetical protein